MVLNGYMKHHKGRCWQKRKKKNKTKHKTPNLSLIKLRDLSPSLQEMQGTEEQIK